MHGPCARSPAVTSETLPEQSRRAHNMRSRRTFRPANPQRAPRRLDPVSGRLHTSDSLLPKPLLLGSGVLSTREPVFWSWQKQPQDHEWLWVLQGAVTIETRKESWTISAGNALWIPQQMERCFRAPGNSVFGRTFISAHRTGFRVCSMRAEPTPAPLRQLLLHMNTHAVEPDIRRRMELACLELWSSSAHERDSPQRPAVPRPLDPRLSLLAGTLKRSPADGRSLDEWAKILHLSQRTINRILHSETGMSFTRWRALLRIERAEALLASGTSVAETAWRVGYQSTSSFVAAFREITGTTPGKLSQARYTAPENPITLRSADQSPHGDCPVDHTDGPTSYTVDPHLFLQ